MVERIDDVPDGVVGVKAFGKLTRDDYRNVMEPALGEAIDSGKARVLFVLESFDGLEPGAWQEDVKTGLSVELRHRKEWERLAVVTDVDWVAKAMRLFAWLMPGELKIFALGDLEEAKGWVSG